MDTRLKERVLKAQTDENELNSFIAEWEPFILDVASNIAERMITRQDEEWIVAWSSFYEAIKRYTEDRGDFKHYAEILVRKKILNSLPPIILFIDSKCLDAILVVSFQFE